MRRFFPRLSTWLAAAMLAAGAAAADEFKLLSVAANPDIAPYAAKVRDLLHLHGKACDAVIEINAFPAGAGLRTVAVCTGGSRYEILFDGTNVTIVAP